MTAAKAKGIARAIIVSFLLSGADRASAQPTPVVTLDDAYRAALERTETVPVNRSRVRQAEARVDQTRGRMLPNVAFLAGYTRQDAADTPSAGGGLGRTEQSSARVGLTQPLYQGGRERAGLDIARAAKEATELGLENSKNALFADVARAFYQVTSLEQDIRNLERTIGLTRERVGELQKRVKIGRSRTGEILNAQSQLALLEAQLEAARGGLTIARDNFAFTTGLDRASRLDGAQTPPTGLEKVEAYLARAEKRPDIQALQIELRAAQSSVDVARGGHLPTVNLTGNYYLARTGSQEGVDWDAGVALVVPIYEGGITQARVREAKEQETETALLLRQRKRAAETEIRAAHHDLSSLLEQIKTLESAVASTERNYREQTRDYRFGVVTNLEVLQALNAAQEAKRALDRTRYQTLVAWANLRAAVAQVP